MSKLFVNRVILWIACCLAVPAASGALPLTGSDSASDPIAKLADPDDVRQGSADPVSELARVSGSRHLDTMLELPS